MSHESNEELVTHLYHVRFPAAMCVPVFSTSARSVGG
jgi:hypothetical protein